MASPTSCTLLSQVSSYQNPLPMTVLSPASAVTVGSTTVGSGLFSSAALLIVCLLVLLLLRHFLPLRTTPAYLLAPIFLALALPGSIILLVPIDLASSAGTDPTGSRGVWLPKGVLLVAWRITYWLCFVLTWLILPILQYYTDSGYRSPKERFFDSLRQNARYQLIVLSCGTVGLVYFFIQYGVGFTSIKALVMALAYGWGLILAIYLMGHGLVAIPRRLFRDAEISGKLRRLQSKAPKLHDKLTDSVQDLEELELQVVYLRQRKSGTAPEFQEWIDELAEIAGLPESSHRSLTLAGGALQEPPVPTVITEQYLAELTRRLKQARHKRVRFIDAWNSLVQDSADTQAILDSNGSKRLEFSGALLSHATGLERFTLLTPYSRHLLYFHIVPFVRYLLGALYSLASVCIVWSELVKIADPKLSLIGLTVVHHPSSERGQIGFAGQVIAAGWILYMCAAALTSINDAKVWGDRALVRRNTYGESACWYASQIAKLTVPLTYNFVTFLPPPIYRNTTFYHFLGSLINLTPLGSGFDDFFPIFILVPVVATLFNLYGKVKNMFGFGLLEDEDMENESGLGTGGWREGRNLIERELSGDSSLARHSSALSHSGGASNSSLSGTRTFSPSRSINTRSARLRDEFSSSTIRGPQSQSARRAPVGAQDAVPEDESFFTDFAHRARNTFDTVDIPKWMKGMTRPKWMGGVEADGGEQSTFARRYGRWFGGRPADGRVRLS